MHASLTGIINRILFKHVFDCGVKFDARLLRILSDFCRFHRFIQMTILSLIIVKIHIASYTSYILAQLACHSYQPVSQ